jgi:hypothetical protein
LPDRASEGSAALPNWRWGVSDETSYQYPDLHLHRRTQGGSWEDVVDALVLR